MDNKNIVIDALMEVDIYPEYEKNLMFCKDMVSLKWNELFKNQIAGFQEREVKNLRFFINTIEEENINKIQLRYNLEKEPKHYAEIRGIVVDKIREMEKIYLANDKFIREATKLAEYHLSLLDEGDYGSFFSFMAEEVKGNITNEVKRGLVEYRKKLKLDDSKRKFLYRNLIKLDTPNLENNKVDFVEINFSHKNNKVQEKIVYKLIEGKTTLFSYNI